MAIVTERFEDSVDLVRTYSDQGMMIRQDGTGILYTEAVDPDYMNRTYTETDIQIEQSEEEEQPIVPDEDGYLPPQGALDMIFGEQ